MLPPDELNALVSSYFYYPQLTTWLQEALMGMAVA